MADPLYAAGVHGTLRGQGLLDGSREFSVRDGEGPSERAGELGTVDEQVVRRREACTMCRMIYRLGFWIGPPQAGAEAACADFHTRLLVAEELWTTFNHPPPPVPRIRRFAEAVLEAIPEDLSEESCPWKYHDVAADAVADTFMPMLRGPHREAIGVLTLLAREHGLQAIDLAAHQILSTADVDLRDGVPWTSARLGGGWDEPEYFDCRGPEIARERLGLPPVGLGGDEDPEAIDGDDVGEDPESLEERGSASRDGAVR